ncbi:MAG: hypothetical protein Q7R32_06710 [Dehalococcoidia bacterium]|nr:hypothetical protein [Dehalococcoidia bacterium]
MIVVRPDGTRSKTELQSHEVSAKFARDELARGGGKQLVDAIHTLGSGLGEEMERTLLRKMSQLAEGSGAMFGGKTPQALRRSVLKALRSMDIDFDEEDKPSLIMVAHPEAARRLQELETPELQEKVDSILEEKRNEWLRRESHRRLAD